jgi:hypothetical protein
MSIISMRARDDIRNAFKGKEKRERCGREYGGRKKQEQEG